MQVRRTPLLLAIRGVFLETLRVQYPRASDFSRIDDHQKPRPANAKAEPEDREEFDQTLKKSAGVWTPK